MLRLDTEREKMVNAILFFARNVKHPTKTKIYKLLFFLDFTHFKQVGRPVTGLEYFTWRWGPAPRSLHNEIEETGTIRGFEKYLRIIPTDHSEVEFPPSAWAYTPGVIMQSPTKEPWYMRASDEAKKSYVFKALQTPNMDVFSPREQEILEQVAMIYRDVNASEISEISHLKNQPWHETLTSKGENQKIDYLLALDEDAEIDKDTAIERMQERKEIQSLFPVD